MNEGFEIHPGLAADCFEVAAWPLCRVLLMNDANFPWLVLVPARPGLKDLDDLDAADTVTLGEETRRAMAALRALHSPDKMNVAALGNHVPQLHVHVIARFHTDPAWPKPIWGVVPARPYSDAERRAVLEKLQDAFKA